MGPSTHNLTALPDAGKLKALCQSLARLDAIISPEWERGNITFPDAEFSDGSEICSICLMETRKHFKAIVEEYYEHEISLDAVKYIYKHQPLTNSILAAINPQLSREDLEEDIAEIGYPSKLE